ncbi:hypothetical protein BDF20DRAFT_894256 [Mycotypha africana]|uniref:uncharacterized protein n=1 Tax=Mycotypha africana TaxID=64632 RepID=UPI00230100C1|nr:uncharacterized protein BDF20DRAFT_894256 [Mycotypha africana]KAI8969295.1 hypothetical protein BDF20DRAFT_894256 [Mycotypha africana]
MSFSRSPPQSPPSSHDDWLYRNPLSKTFSTSSSRSMSHNSRAQSLASAPGKTFSTTVNFEATARIYHAELKTYLKNLLAQEAIEGPNSQRVNARQKLVRLSNLQFHELAMDVYDEVVRRNKNDKYLPFLPVKEDLHPKRNQARQKLATLPVARFQDLASDVYAEISRRYPRLSKNEDEYYSPPLPQSPISPMYGKIYADQTAQPQPSKSTNIVPVKSTMNVETIERFSDDDDDQNSNVTHRRQRSPSTSPIKEGAKDYLPRSSDARLPKNNQKEAQKLSAEYHHQIDALTDKIAHLQNELSYFKGENGNDDADRNVIDKLRTQEQENQRTIHELEERYKKLSAKYERLQQQYDQQQDAVRDVKAETKHMLNELKHLAEANDDLLLEKEKAENQIQQLHDEIKDLQLKYEKARIELRNVKASSIIELNSSSDFMKRNILQPTRNGIIPQDHLLTYQAYIDELLTTARSNDPSQVIHVMKNIVTVCKHITEEIEAQEGSVSLDTKNSLYEIKAQFTTSLSDLLMTTKYHANGMGISPVCLLDRSASHLTSNIVELVKLLGMSSKPASNLSTSPPTDTDKIPEKLGTLSFSSSTTAIEPSSYRSNNASRRIGGKEKSHHGSYDDASFIKTRHDKASFLKTSDSALSLDLSTTPEDSTADRFLDYKQRPSFKKYTSNRHANEEMTPEKLVAYLTSETDSIVQTIQNLLSALKLPQQNGEVYAIIHSMIKIVSKIIDTSEAACATSMGLYYKRDCEQILRQLTKCAKRISVIQSEQFVRGATPTANAKRDLAKETYEIAKFTKELISLFESK